MDVKECLSFGVRVLKNPFEAELLLSYALRERRESLTAYPEKPVDVIRESEYRKSVLARERGIPMAYLIGNKEFYGLDFFVDGRVLIPRPETELLVDIVIDEIEKRRDAHKHSGKIFDCGTGSGNIVIALAKKFTDFQFIAGDISDEALAVAKINAEKHEVNGRISFVRCDLMENVSGPISGIVANLPYIGTSEFSFVEKNTVDYEPNIALFGGEDGLKLYKKLFNQISRMKKMPAFIVGEFGFLQMERMRVLLYKFFDQNSVFFHKDLAGIDRAFSVIME